MSSTESDYIAHFILVGDGDVDQFFVVSIGDDVRLLLNAGHGDLRLNLSSRCSQSTTAGVQMHKRSNIYISLGNTAIPSGGG